MSPAFIPPRVLRSFLLCCLLPVLAFAATLPLAAQTAATGTVHGRVLNAATHEYIRNAEIRVEGAPNVVYSTEGGDYFFTNVPAGDATIVANYSGLQETKAIVNILAGQTVSHDFSLQETSYGTGDDNTVKMAMLEIAGTRNGQAKALMERRASTNAKNIVASDNYGDLTMGDVGEFMKSMPGLSIDYVEVDTSAVRIGGLDPKYSTFTMDGARMATATSNNNAGRQNSFEQMSITGIESIEFNNTLTASLDADSPGGNINLRSKYAFENTDRTIVFQLYGVGTSDAKLERSYFPDDQKHDRIFPSGQLGYSDIFLNGKLGVAFNASYNANFVEQDRNQIQYNYSDAASGTTVDNPKINNVMWRPGPKMTQREAANLAVDYKLMDNLVFSWRSSYSFYGVEYVNQYTYLYTPVANQSTGSTIDHLLLTPVATNGTNAGKVSTGSSSPRLATAYSHRYAGTPTALLVPKLEYKGDTWQATLRGSYAQARYNFKDAGEGFFQRTDDWITRLGFTLDRPTADSPTWTLNQTAGRPWGDATSWNRDDAIGNNIRAAGSKSENEQYTGYLDLKKNLSVGGLPITLLGGLGGRTNTWKTNEGSYAQYTYVGPTGKQTDPEAIVPATQNYKFDVTLDGKEGNINAQNWRADSNYAMYDIFKQHPEYFTPDTVGNLQRQLQNNKKISEKVDAAYLESQTRLGKARFDLGIRYETTDTSALVADVRPTKDVTAAGLSTSTVQGVLYQYNNGKQNTRYGKYDDFFASGGVKYDITRKLVAQVAFSQAILRPDYANLGGVTTVNDSNLTVTVPNTELKPEHSTKYYAGLQYFLEPSGVLGVSYYKLDVKDMQVTGITVDPTDVGYSATDYPGYTFVSAQNAPGISRTDGMVLEYSQQLTFLPGAFKGLSTYGSVTRVMADGVRVSVPNKAANWGLRYHYGRFNTQINGNYQSRYRVSALSNTVTTSNTGIVYEEPRVLWNISASFRLTKHFDIMMSGRNIFNAPDIQYSNVPGRLYLYSRYGSLWDAGIKGTF